MNRQTVALFLSIALLPAAAQPKRPPSTPSECRNFVKSFYDWYVPVAHMNSPRPSWDLAIHEKGSLFSARLLRALRADMEAWEKSQAGGESESLDFDPFLFSQDPAASYEPGKINLNGPNCKAELYGIVPGKKKGKPDVVAELTFTASHWIFVNFRDGTAANPGEQNLLGTLAALRASRRKPK